jgi:hypothetical protein
MRRKPFELDWHEPLVMASVSRDGRGLMLCEGGQGNPGTWVWIGVDDTASLFDEYRARGGDPAVANQLPLGV